MHFAKLATCVQRCWKRALLTLGIAAVLAVGFGYIYFDDHAWGAWGDDSPGYIFLAGRMYAQQPLVYYDEWAAKGYEFFQDEKLTRWLTPTHHSLINRHGVMASKYPVGLSLLMVLAAQIAHSSYAFYVVVPLCGALNIALVYLLALVLFPASRFRHVIGIATGLMLGLSELYYEYAVSQPMRELPSMTFLLVLSLALIVGYNRRQTHPRQLYVWAGVAGLCFGMAINIRETSLLMLPAVGVLALHTLWKKSASWKQNLQRFVVLTAVFVATSAIALTPSILNAARISKDKEVFKPRDISRVVVLPNIGHIETISLSNLFHTEGKFRPGEGSLPHYIEVLEEATPIPYFWVLVGIGLWAMMRQRESRPRGVFLVLWSLGILTIFSLWINPYSRYILPMFPAYLLLGIYGAFAFVQQILPRIVNSAWMRRGVGAVIFITCIAAYQPTYATINTNLQSDIYLESKSLSRADLDQLVGLGTTLSSYTKPVLMFTGARQYGTSETFEAHTGVKSIRFPLEQKFPFQIGETVDFVDQRLSDGYTLFIWTDVTSSEQVFEWLDYYDVQAVSTLDFGFQKDVRIWQVKLKHQ